MKKLLFSICFISLSNNLKLYIYIYIFICLSCLWGLYSLSFGSFLWSAPVQGETAEFMCVFFILLKHNVFCWYCECAQIKVEPLQFQMIYYSFNYEQKWLCI